MTREDLRRIVDNLTDEEVAHLGHALELILRRVGGAPAPEAPLWASRLTTLEAKVSDLYGRVGYLEGTCRGLNDRVTSLSLHRSSTPLGGS
jgi:hypothetical protein